jgi:hypothetical protein
MRRFFFNASVLGALFGGVTALRATLKGPRDWRLILIWIGWLISVVLAVSEVAKEIEQEEIEDSPYDF